MSRELKAKPKELKKLGVSVYNANGEMRDMGSILIDVEKAMKGKTDAERDAALQTVFTGQAMRGVNAFLAKGADGYKELESAIYQSSGAAQDMADLAEDNMAGSIRSLQSAWEGFQIELGTFVNEYGRPIVDWATGLITKFNDMDEEQKNQIFKWGAIAAAIGPALLAGSKIIAVGVKIPGIIGGMGTALGAIFSPVGLVVAAIGGLIGITVHLFRTNDEFREKVTGTWDSIVSITQSAAGALKSLWGAIGEDVKSVVSGTIEVVTGIIESFVNVVSGVVGVIKGIIDGDWAAVWSSGGDIVKGFLDFFVGIPAKIFDIGANMAKAAVKGVKSVGTGIVNWATGKGKKDKVGVNGSHANGLASVPFDGYVAELHKDEEVLTANDPRNRNNSRAIGGSQVVKFEPRVEINIEGNVDDNTLPKLKGLVKSELEALFVQLQSQM